jgi:uncharacterized protein YcfJ
MIGNKLNKTILVSLLLASASLTANAGHDRYEDRARVISVTPQVERINTPVQECRTEYVRESYYEESRRSNGGAIVGTIAGGLIGSRFGGGNGRLVTTAVGAGLGAVIGDRHDNRYNQPREQVQTRPVERCVTVDRWETVNRGYLVDYEYHGRRYTTETLDHPGRYIPVDVSVRPSGHVMNVEYRYQKNHFNNRKNIRRHY